MSLRQHFWTTGEDRKLRELYPAHGPKGVQNHLPGRSYSSIVTRASTLGVRFVGYRGPSTQRKWTFTPEIERELRALYATPPVAGAVKALAERLGVPFWWLKRRAADIGVARAQKRQPPWSDAEDQIVSRFHGRTIENIQRRLAACGFHRTLTAIGIRRKRLGLSCRPAGYYTATEIGKMLGVDIRTPAFWIKCGWLEARRRKTERTEAQGGDMFWVREEDLRQFILDNPHRIDLRKVPDAEWFIRLVAGRKGDGRHHKRKAPGREAA